MMEVLAFVVFFGIFALLAYSLCCSAGRADEEMERGFSKAFLEGDSDARD